MPSLRSLIPAAALVAAGAGPAGAGEITSAYTKLELDKCELVSSNPDEGGSAVWNCKGYDGRRVRVAEGDLRFFVSYGPDAESQKAAHQTLAPFNVIHHTLEWRLERRNGRQVPFATILRYFWDSGNGRKGQTLVVTKLGPDEACHVAHVVAQGNPGANRMAREAADTEARSFDCAHSAPLRYGPDGRKTPN